MATARAANETAAANGALRELGVPRIGSLDEDNHRARTLRNAFGDVRDALLREQEWNFATAWVVPPREATDGIGEWSKRYRMPADCLRLRSVLDLEADEWGVETLDSGLQVLVTEADAPRVCYTKRIDNPALWDPQFLRAFQKRLAAAVAQDLARSTSFELRKDDQADELTAKAARIDARERSSSIISRDTSWIQARRRGC